MSFLVHDDPLAAGLSTVGGLVLSSAAAYYLAVYLLPKIEFPTGPALFQVSFDDGRYYPSEITVRPGDIVEWTNEGTLEHDVVSGVHGGVDQYHAQVFASPPLPPGGKFTWTASIPSFINAQPHYNGAIPVHCHIHALPTGGKIRFM